MTETVNMIVFIVACITAGEAWNNFGYISDWRKNRNNPNWAGFDKKSLKHDLLLGFVLGIGLVIYQAVTVGVKIAGTPIGFEIPEYTTFQVFVQSVISMIPAVVAVDKVLVGGVLNINSSSTPNSLIEAPKTDLPPTTLEVKSSDSPQPENKSVSVSDSTSTTEK